MSDRRRVVITGLGCITSLGHDAKTNWKNLLDGQSGVKTIDHFEVDDLSVRFASCVQDFDVAAYIDKKEQKKMDTFMQYGVAAAVQAVNDSGLDFSKENSDRAGVAIGSGIGGLPMIEDTKMNLMNAGPRRVSPFFVPGSIINMISGHVSIRYGLRGPNFAVVTACSTGTNNIGEATRMIRYNDADIMIAGGSEMATTRLTLAGFGSARALSTRNDDPQTASRPFDSGRDGFVLGEGAGVVVLEEYEHAKKRGAHIYAEVIGYGVSSDAYHMTLPREDGSGASRCMQKALTDAKVDTDSVGYINAHGTSTPSGDIAETKAIKSTFGGHAYELSVSSTKSMTGHLLGGAGGIETVYTALTIEKQIAPPTINIFEQDPACDLDVVANAAKDLVDLDVALSNSFGFGGTNACIALRRI